MQAGNLLRPDFGPFKGLEYFLACGDAARRDSTGQLALINQWMLMAHQQGEVDKFRIVTASILSPQTMQPVPAWMIEYTTAANGGLEAYQVAVKTSHLTKEMAVVMYVHDT